MTTTHKQAKQIPRYEFKPADDNGEIVGLTLAEYQTLNELGKTTTLNFARIVDKYADFRMNLMYEEAHNQKSVSKLTAGALEREHDEAFDKWFERNWSIKYLEKRLLEQANKGVTCLHINLTKGVDSVYEKRRLLDDRFLKKLKSGFPGLSVEKKKYIEKHTPFFGTKEYEAEHYRIVISWRIND